MFREIKELITKDQKLQWLLLVMFIVQMITAVTQLGFFHPDQHFQIVEFSTYQRHQESGATVVWELKAAVRPTLQVYLFSGYTIVCEFLKITDPYLQMTILRIILSLIIFVVFSAISIYYLRNAEKIILYSVLCLLNLSWFFPYIKTLFSSEILSSLVFFTTIFWYDLKKDRSNFLFVVLIGFLLSLSFYFRFQIGFAIAGFGLWMLITKRFNHILPLVIGFLIGILLNTYLDKQFYHSLVFTPYQYFKVNILQGVAASFGKESFLRYVAVLVGFISIPPLSLILLFLAIRACYKNFHHPFVLPVALFIIGHCFIDHKEDRFLYPVFFVLPVIIGLQLPALVRYYENSKRWIQRSLKGIVVFSAVLNFIFLASLLFNPFAQTVYFSKLLQKNFDSTPVTIYCLARTPYETESGLPLTFYKRNAKNIDLKKISLRDLPNYLNQNILLATTYNQVKQQKHLVDSLGYRPVLYSSELLWKVNEYLDKKKANTINDIWVLYKKD